jgi:hypothetical protein
MGNPHALVEVEDVRARRSRRRPRAAGQRAVSRRASTSASRRCCRAEIRLRVVERGVGETLACGSGACAAVAIWPAGQGRSPVDVHLPGGTLSIDWPGDGRRCAWPGRPHSYSKGSGGNDGRDEGTAGRARSGGWLRRHPKFLAQFPDLALSLVVPREDGPAASLASYQLEVLRDKNRELGRAWPSCSPTRRTTSASAIRTHQLRWR